MTTFKDVESEGLNASAPCQILGRIARTSDTPLPHNGLLSLEEL